MKLTNIGFNYKVRSKQFKYINYSFTVPLKDRQKESTILTQILESEYKLPRFQKLTEGEVSNYSLENKTTYIDRLSPALVFFGKFNLISFIEQIPLSQLENNLEANLEIITKEYYCEKLFSIYSQILGLEQLKISKRAQIQIDRIKYLKEQSQFTTNNFLSIGK